MDGLLTLLGLGLGLVALATPVVAIVALARTKRLEDLAERLFRVESQLARLKKEPTGASTSIPAHLGRTSVTPGPAPEPKPVLTEEITAAPPRPAGVTIEGPEPEREPVQPVSATVTAEPERPVPPVEPGPVPTRSPAETRIDWERWLGIRGAAFAGGAFLVLAGFFFFKHAIAVGWFGPGARILIGSAVGLVCLLSRGFLERHGYRSLSEVLAGSGAVLLYAAAWASYRLYEFIDPGWAFAWMGAVTLLSCVQAVRYGSQTIAIFALLGGFATPLLLSDGSNRPIGLFGYVLLLDLGLLALGRRKDWPLLGPLCLAGTTLMQGLWVARHLDDSGLGLALVILGVFAVLFTLVGRRVPETARPQWIASRAGGIGAPFVFALYFATRVDLGPHLWPLGILLVFLCTAACWIEREERVAGLSVGAAVGGVAVAGTWLAQITFTNALLWEYVGVAIAIVAVPWTFALLKFLGEQAETSPAVGRSDESAAARWDEGVEAAVLVAVFGFLGTLVVATVGVADIAFWPVVTGVAILGTALFQPRRELPVPELPLGLGAVIGAILGIFAYRVVPGVVPGPFLLTGTVIAFSAGLAALGIGRGDGARWFCLAIVFAAAPAVALIQPEATVGAGTFFGVVLALAATAVAGAVSAGSWPGYVVSVWSAAVAATRWNTLAAASDEAVPVIAIVLQAVLVAALTLLPVWLRPRDRRGLILLWVGAAAPLLWCLPQTVEVVGRALGVESGLPILLAALAAITAIGAARLLFEPVRDGDGSRDGLAPYSAAAAAFASFALTRSIDSQHWVLVGAALMALAWVALARGFDWEWLGAGGKLVSIGSAALLLVMALQRGTFAHTESLLLNKFSYVYLVPVLCSLGIFALLRRPAEERVDVLALPVAAALLGFAWLNLVVVNQYSDGEWVRFFFDRMFARDLVLSLSWTGYAITLLVLGTARKIAGLRWMSLGFFLLTIGKVFLYDLGELDGLYRVGSFLGLAVCLLLVSLLYQRFVFRRPAPA